MQAEGSLPRHRHKPNMGGEVVGGICLLRAMLLMKKVVSMMICPYRCHFVDIVELSICS